MPINSPILPFSSLAHYFLSSDQIPSLVFSLSHDITTAQHSQIKYGSTIPCCIQHHHQSHCQIQSSSICHHPSVVQTTHKTYFAFKTLTKRDISHVSLFTMFLSFQAVKTVRRHRPQLVENLVHILFSFITLLPSLKSKYLVSDHHGNCLSKKDLPQKHEIEIFHSFPSL